MAPTEVIGPIPPAMKLGISQPCRLFNIAYLRQPVTVISNP